MFRRGITGLRAVGVRGFHSVEHQAPAVNKESVHYKILDTALAQFVPKFGFSEESVLKSSRELGYSDSILSSFNSNFEFQLAQFHLKQKRLNLAEISKSPEFIVLTSQESKINYLLKQRLLLNADIAAHLQQLQSILVKPFNFTESSTELHNLSDDILFLSNDVSNEFNWYTKRLSLSSNYVLFELFMANDKSPGFKNTLNFVDDKLASLNSFNKSIDDTNEFLKYFLNSSANLVKSKMTQFYRRQIQLVENDCKFVQSYASITTAALTRKIKPWTERTPRHLVSENNELVESSLPVIEIKLNDSSSLKELLILTESLHVLVVPFKNECQKIGEVCVYRKEVSNEFEEEFIENEQLYLNKKVGDGAAGEAALYKTIDILNYKNIIYVVLPNLYENDLIIYNLLASKLIKLNLDKIISFAPGQIDANIMNFSDLSPPFFISGFSSCLINYSNGKLDNLNCFILKSDGVVGFEKLFNESITAASDKIEQLFSLSNYSSTIKKLTNFNNFDNGLYI